MATKTKERTSRMVMRAIVLRGGKGITYCGVPAHVGAYIPWEPHYPRLVGLGYLAKTKVDAAALTPCPYHDDLSFVNEEMLAKHIEDDERLIETLRESIPALEAQADALDQAAEGTSAADFPMMIDAGFLAQRRRDGFTKDAEDKRSDAVKLRAELEKMGVQ